MIRAKNYETFKFVKVMPRLDFGKTFLGITA